MRGFLFQHAKIGGGLGQQRGLQVVEFRCAALLHAFKRICGLCGLIVCINGVLPMCGFLGLSRLIELTLANALFDLLLLSTDVQVVCVRLSLDLQMTQLTFLELRRQ